MRQFLALEIPDEMRSALAGLQEELRQQLPGWRWVGAGNIHLTMRFLGQVDSIEDWSLVARRCSPCKIRLGGVGQFPPRGRPRVLHVAVEEAGPVPTLARLAHEVEAAARKAGFDPENRTFRPHLTLARAARDRSPLPPPRGVGVPGLEAHIEHLTLFRSELDPRGARYTVLASYPLGAGQEADSGPRKR